MLILFDCVLTVSIDSALNAATLRISLVWSRESPWASTHEWPYADALFKRSDLLNDRSIRLGHDFHRFTLELDYVFYSPNFVALIEPDETTVEGILLNSALASATSFSSVAMITFNGPFSVKAYNVYVDVHAWNCCCIVRERTMCGVVRSAYFYAVRQ